MSLLVGKMKIRVIHSRVPGLRLDQSLKTNLKSVQGAVILHEEVFLFTDGEVVTKLTEKVS